MYIHVSTCTYLHVRICKLKYQYPCTLGVSVSVCECVCECECTWVMECGFEELHRQFEDHPPLVVVVEGQVDVGQRGDTLQLQELCKCVGGGGKVITLKRLEYIHVETQAMMINLGIEAIIIETWLYQFSIVT